MALSKSELSEETVTSAGIIYMKSVIASKEDLHMRSFANAVSHINTQVLKKRGWHMNTKETPTSTFLLGAFSKYKSYRKELTAKKALAPPRIETAAFSQEQFYAMLSESAGTNRLMRTTRQQARLIYGLITLAWGQRNKTWWKLKMHHVRFVPDNLSKCGFKVVKNFIPTKTNLIANPRVETGDYDREDTVYCQCDTHEICPVKELKWYVDCLADGHTWMKRPRGAHDGAKSHHRKLDGACFFRRIFGEPQIDSACSPAACRVSRLGFLQTILSKSN